MNEERLIKLIEDMSEVIEHLKDCEEALISEKDNRKALFMEYGLKQIFVDYFITVENFVSMMLKELKKFKIGIDMKTALVIINEANVIDDNVYEFLDNARLIRNRISHRYKEPTRDELIEFISENIDCFSEVLNIARKMIIVEDCEAK